MRHRRHVRNLSIAITVIAALAVVIHPAMIGFALLIAPLLVFELRTIRRSVSRASATHDAAFDRGG